MSFKINGWTITSTKGPIATASESDELSQLTGFPLPTMIFPHNSVCIRRDDSADVAEISFDTRSAIASVSKESPSDIKVVYSQQSYWKQKQLQFKMELDYDWTYTCPYSGSLKGFVEEETVDSIDYGKLRAAGGTDVIFYDENVLFEDEMGDNGSAIFSVKTRAMEYGVFVLARSYVRVDNVIFRSLETRYFIDFSTNRILKESRYKEDPFETIYQVVGREKFHDSNHVADQLTCLRTSTVQLVEKL